VKKILIVDDEPLMRKIYTNLIDWESHGFTLAGEARDGAEALDIVKNEQIDIVITDLKMPVMDGLTFIGYAKKEKPNIKFVIMSGFDEFHLVNKAYKLGVCDYLLKLELSAETVLATLMKLTGEIEDEKLRKQIESDKDKKLEEMERTLSINRLALREKLLKELFWGGNTKDAGEKMREQGILIDEKNISVMVIKLEEYYTVEKELYNGDRELFKFAVVNVIEEVINSFESICQLHNPPHEYVIVFSSNTAEDCPRKASDIFMILKRSIENCFGIRINGGISQVADGYHSCKELYEQAHSACDYGFIKGKGRLISHREILYTPTTPEIDFRGKVKLLKEILKSMDNARILNAIPELRIEPSCAAFQDIGEVKNLFYIYYYTILEYAKLHDLDAQIAEQLNKYENNIQDFGDLAELNLWINSIMLALADVIKSGRMMNRAKSFIQNNYEKHILLSDVAEHLQISQRHLTRLFTEETGMNFTAYLLKVRMDAAISLMKDTDLKVYEIADKVGYANVEQFSRMFKKTMGMSPKEYLIGQK